MADLTDREFLRYCEGMAATPRCGFVPQHVARLIRLSGGDEKVARSWERLPIGVHNLDPDQVLAKVEEARYLLQDRMEPNIP